MITHLDVRPLDTPHRPSVDVLFQSAADVYGGRVLGVVMTGMGADGREGAAWIKAKGGTILTEAEETCVVYGMPRSVVEAGLSDRSVDSDGMADAILERRVKRKAAARGRFGAGAPEHARDARSRPATRSSRPRTAWRRSSGTSSRSPTSCCSIS